MKSSSRKKTESFELSILVDHQLGKQESPKNAPGKFSLKRKCLREANSSDQISFKLAAIVLPHKQKVEEKILQIAQITKRVRKLTECTKLFVLFLITAVRN